MQELHAVCQRYGVASLEVTGSAARSDFDPKSSDIDLLVEFRPGARVSALEFVNLAEELESILGHHVDLIELCAVTNPILRESLASDRTPFYAAA